MTGGRDGVVTMWDPLFEQCLKAFKVEEASMNPGSVLLQNLPPVRALHTDENKILIGTGNDEVHGYDFWVCNVHTSTTPFCIVQFLQLQNNIQCGTRGVHQLLHVRPSSIAADVINFLSLTSAQP